jgi:hypothetical protein
MTHASQIPSNLLQDYSGRFTDNTFPVNLLGFQYCFLVTWFCRDIGPIILVKALLNQLQQPAPILDAHLSYFRKFDHGSPPPRLRIRSKTSTNTLNGSLCRLTMFAGRSKALQAIPNQLQSSGWQRAPTDSRRDTVQDYVDQPQSLFDAHLLNICRFHGSISSLDSLNLCFTGRQVNAPLSPAPVGKPPDPERPQYGIADRCFGISTASTA